MIVDRSIFDFRFVFKALSFAERFNGYVFVDKQGNSKDKNVQILSIIFWGNESMGIVECAPNQTVPKKLGIPAKQSDERVDTLTDGSFFQIYFK